MQRGCHPTDAKKNKRPSSFLCTLSHGIEPVAPTIRRVHPSPIVMDYPPTPPFVFASRLDCIVDYVRALMNSYNDPSHDFRHIVRVCVAVRRMYDDGNLVASENDSDGTLLDLATLIALCHDVFDGKFIDSAANARHRSELHGLLCDAGYDRASVARILDVIASVSWSKFRARNFQPPAVKDGTPFEATLQRAWMLASNADWYDGLLIVRSRDYHASKGGGSLSLPSSDIADGRVKHDVVCRWNDALRHLPEHAFFTVSERMLRSRHAEQRRVLCEWIGDTPERWSAQNVVVDH